MLCWLRIRRRGLHLSAVFRYPSADGTKRELSSTAPQEIPADLQWAFTRCGIVPVSAMLIDERRHGTAMTFRHERKELEASMQQAKRWMGEY